MVSMLSQGVPARTGVDESGEGMHVVFWQRREELGDDSSLAAASEVYPLGISLLLLCPPR